MDFLEHLNSIAETGYKSGITESLEETFRSITFTYYNLVRIISKASKKLILTKELDDQNITEDSHPLHKLIKNAKTLSKDVETYCKSIFTS